MTERDELAPAKASIIDEMFIHTADENYITARWCHDNGLVTDFFWNALHALEKYMKAVLLFNGVQAKTHSHGLPGLYDEVEKIAGGLLPKMLERPGTLDIYHWVDLTPKAFMEKLEQNGNADNRYLTHGYVLHAWYLHMVDTMVWTIRRLAVPLDRKISTRRDDAPTHRDILTRQREYSPTHHQTVDKLINDVDGEARRALLNNNCAFAPDGYPHQPRRSGSSSRNPVLLRRILQPLEAADAATVRHGYRMGEWLLANTKQSKGVADQIKAAMAKALASHPGIDKPSP